MHSAQQFFDVTKLQPPFVIRQERVLPGTARLPVLAPGHPYALVAEMRWPDVKPECPHCGGWRHYWLAKVVRWKCAKCRKQFTAKAGTIFLHHKAGRPFQSARTHLTHRQSGWRVEADRTGGDSSDQKPPRFPLTRWSIVERRISSSPLVVIGRIGKGRLREWNRPIP